MIASRATQLKEMDWVEIWGEVAIARIALVQSG